MSKVNVLVLRAAGINCDEEVMHCWKIAGASPTLMHINELTKQPKILDDIQIVTLPGGFSYGDDIAAGVILAQRLQHDIAGPMKKLIDRGGGILGICNGFQVMVKMGLLPGVDNSTDQVTVTYNDSAKFEARWVKMRVTTDRCVFLKKDSVLEMPVEHAEGKVVTVDENVADQLDKQGLIAVKYVDENGCSDKYPENPNGSVAGIAGLCDPTGRVFGLMPHPDRHFDHTHHPQWTRRTFDHTPDGLTVFQNAVSHWSK